VTECIACSTPMVSRFPGRSPNHWRCPQCGLECISPQPDDQTLAEIYTNRYFSHYQTDSDIQTVRAMKRDTYGRQFLRLPAPETFGGQRRLLDCGAATGYLAELAKEAGWDSFAIEISEFGARACSLLLGTDRVYRGEVKDSSFAANPEGHFEVITMFDFIEHVRDPRAVLTWARKRLSPGGVLLLTTPQTGSISWHLMRRDWFHYVDEHLWFFSPQSIRALLDQTGFNIVGMHALQKAVTVGYALGHYERRTTQSTLFSPAARALKSIIPGSIQRQCLRFYLGEMVVLAQHGHGSTDQNLSSDPVVSRLSA